MLQIAICDDIKLHGTYTSQVIQAYPPCKTAPQRIFEGATAMLDAINGGYAPDIAVLDIQMDTTDGIDLAKTINQLLPSCRIIFLSAYIEYAPEVYSTEHVYFVLKNRINEDLYKALDKCLSLISMARAQSITFTDGSISFRININEITYIERVLHKSLIRTTTGEYQTKTSPAKLLFQIDSGMFFQCHRSYYVNLSHVIAMSPDSFIVSGNHFVPISRAYKKAAKEAFLFRE